MTVRICGMMIVIAALFATPSFAEPTELDKKTVASKAYVDTKQDKITTGLVEFDDLGVTATVPALVVTNSTGTALNGNTIGFLDLNTYSILNSGLDELPDTMVPSIGLLQGQIDNILNVMPYWSPLPWSVNINGTPDNGATQTAAINAYNTTFGNGTNNWAGSGIDVINGQFLANSLALKQNKLPAKSTGNAAPKGSQAVVLGNNDGYPTHVYTTAGKNLALTEKSGAQKVMNYIDGTTASATFATSQGLTEAQVKSALVSLELLKDVYSELNAKITNNALPTGTTGTVVTYNGTNAQTGVQEFTETAISGTATYDDNDQLTNGNNIANVSLVETEIATRQKKRTCAGYEPGHENEADYCWLWNFPD